LAGWRKLEDWRRRFKGLERVASKTVFGGGKDKEKRVRKGVSEYLECARGLSAKVSESLLALCDQAVALEPWTALCYFHEMLDKHIDLVDRRLLQGQKIEASEKVCSLFEPHPEWITQGKLHPGVERGHRMLVTTDQNQLIQDYAVMDQEVDVDQSVPVVDRVLGRYGEGVIARVSFDKGFTREIDRQLLELFVPVVVMPKRGKKNAVETERESDKKFVQLRRAHSAVESAIASLEHHGLNRCLDLGLDGYRRYVGYGVLAYNLHVIGRELLRQQRVRADALARAA
jgi:hypothetical protein